MSEIIPVIHTIDFKQVMYNVNICSSLGINKIFLIDHRIGDDSLQKMQNYIEYIEDRIFPRMEIGVNFLQLDTKDAMIKAQELKVDCLWADNSYINENTLDKAYEVMDYKRRVLYFGCVAFKYQKQPTDLKWACEQAVELMDVITTSGPGTGKPPTLEKIKNMHKFIGGKRKLAIASGIDSENKKIFDEYADYYLVASSIIDKDDYIIESKLKTFLV